MSDEKIQPTVVKPGLVIYDDKPGDGRPRRTFDGRAMREPILSLAKRGGSTRAVFIGADRSLGYRTGQEYVLRLSVDSRARAAGGIFAIRRVDGSGWCPYASEASFLANWRVS